MARVQVELPSLLAAATGGQRSLEIEADTLEEALRVLVTQHPRLKGHVFDERGELRQHVLCFLNETNTRWIEDHGRAVKDGDRIVLLQAVSGG